MKSRIAFLFFLSFIVLVGCRQNKSSDKTQGEITSPELHFRCDTEMNEETGSPHSQVFIVLNGAAKKIADIAACETILSGDYSQHDIPEEAIAACGGWWAGGGDYFYAVLQGREVVVMKGWIEETQGDEGYHYEEILRLPAE